MTDAALAELRSASIVLGGNEDEDFFACDRPRGLAWMGRLERACGACERGALALRRAAGGEGKRRCERTAAMIMRRRS
jgi:hypothetical protein